MNKPFSIVLLVVGVILVIYGISAGESVASEVSEAVSGTPTNRTIWLLVVGIIAGLLGLFGLLRGPKV